MIDIPYLSDLWRMHDGPNFLGASHFKSPQWPVYEQKLFNVMTLTHPFQWCEVCYYLNYYLRMEITKIILKLSRIFQLKVLL